MHRYYSRNHLIASVPSAVRLPAEQYLFRRCQTDDLRFLLLCITRNHNSDYCQNYHNQHREYNHFPLFSSFVLFFHACLSSLFTQSLCFVRNFYLTGFHCLKCCSMCLFCYPCTTACIHFDSCFRVIRLQDKGI